MPRNLLTVAAFAAAGPFTQSQIRWWIFQSGQSGLGAWGAIVRVGRRIYIDTDKFYAWIDAQNPTPVAA